MINVYAQAISLNNVDYYGLGNSTVRSGESVFGMRETIAGASAIVPIFPKLKVSVVRRDERTLRQHSARAW